MRETIQWTDGFGTIHELAPAGTHVLYTGHVITPTAPGMVYGYQATPGMIVGLDLDDKVTPYQVRIWADGAEVMCTPREVLLDPGTMEPV